MREARIGAVAREHACDLRDSRATLHELDLGSRVFPAGLAHDELGVREGRDLSEVCHDDDLPPPCELCEPAPYGYGGCSADSCVDG